MTQTKIINLIQISFKFRPWLRATTATIWRFPMEQMDPPRQPSLNAFVASLALVDIIMGNIRLFGIWFSIPSVYLSAYLKKYETIYFLSLYLFFFLSIYVSLCSIYIYIYMYTYLFVPVVSHKAVPDMFKNWTVLERWVVVMHGWQSEPADGPKGGWTCALWRGCSCHLKHNHCGMQSGMM